MEAREMVEGTISTLNSDNFVIRFFLLLEYGVTGEQTDLWLWRHERPCIFFVDGGLFLASRSNVDSG